MSLLKDFAQKVLAQAQTQQSAFINRIPVSPITPPTAPATAPVVSPPSSVQPPAPVDPFAGCTDADCITKMLLNSVGEQPSYLTSTITTASTAAPSSAPLPVKEGNNTMLMIGGALLVGFYLLKGGSGTGKSQLNGVKQTSSKQKTNRSKKGGKKNKIVL